MKNFDYESAWFEVWLPAFKKLNPHLRTHAERIANDSDISQEQGPRADLNCVVLNDKAQQYIELLKGYDDEVLIEFGRLCYYYCHHFPGKKALEAVGIEPIILAAGWRVQHLVYTMFKQRDDGSTIGLQKKLSGMENSDEYQASESLTKYRREVRIHAVLHPDEAPPEWEKPEDEDGRIEWLGTKMPAGYGMRIGGIHAFNHRLKDKVIPNNFSSRKYNADQLHRHPFMITGKHLEGDSMYLDPNAAPCGICGCNYSDHTCDRAIEIHCHPDVPEDKLGLVLSHVLQDAPVIKDSIIEWGYDGFVFPRSQQAPKPAYDLDNLEPIHAEEPQQGSDAEDGSVAG